MTHPAAPTIESAAKAYAMLGSESVWDVAQRCDQAFAAAGLRYAIVGSVAVCLHGYRRNTVDLDLLVQRADFPAIRQALDGAGFAGDQGQREFRGIESVHIHLLFADEPAGNDRTYAINFPRPGEHATTTVIEGLSVVTLPRLIELKLACGLGDLRRTHRDLADVVELILVNDLHGDFARLLHKSIRPEFCKLVRHARGTA
jgi:hypothetical protein